MNLLRSLNNTYDYLHWSIRNHVGALRKDTFLFNGQTYSYFNHFYNRTWENERIVEVPIAEDFIKNADPCHILEVGNVLNHYEDRRHLVVDRYEQDHKHHVINTDFLAFNWGIPFTHIVSISTFEHFCDNVLDPSLTLKIAFDKVLNLLAPGGKALITIPCGYIPLVDGIVRKDDIGCSSIKAMRKKCDAWLEVDYKTTGGLGPDINWQSAREVLVIYFDKAL
jgi:hypothetical protein